MEIVEIQFQASGRLLEDPNVFIGYIGSSSDTTGSNLGVCNIREASGSDEIVNASGNYMKGQLFGDISGNFCNNFWQGTSNATIKM